MRVHEGFSGGAFDGIIKSCVRSLLIYVVDGSKRNTKGVDTMLEKLRHGNIPC